MKKIVEVKNLNVFFPSAQKKKHLTHIVRNVDFTVYENQIIGFIGESGSGKSVTAKSLLNINNNAQTKADVLKIDDIDLLTPNKVIETSTKQWKKIRGKKVAYIPQDSLTSLNPTKKIGKQITEALKLHSSDLVKESRKKLIEEKEKLVDKLSTDKDNLVAQSRLKEVTKAIKDPFTNYAVELLETFGIKNANNLINSYPHEFSGGMRQRVVIAMMLACNPDVIIADEPTTALDPTIQASVMALFQDVVKKTKTSIILISHDIAVIAKACDYLYIFYAGSVVEKGTRNDIFTDPKHPYTWALLSAIPDSEINQKGKKLYTIEGQPPSFDNFPKGDPFAVRNKFAMEIDFKEQPPLIQISKTHAAATWLLHPKAPKVEMPKQVQKLIKITKKELEKNAKNIDSKSKK